MQHDDPRPPQFAPYDAAYFVSGAGVVVSHDPHLNEDGEALYRFLLSQAVTPPQLFLHCRGSHQETRTRFVPARHNNSDRESQSGLQTEQHTETIVDFDFKIDVGQHILADPTHWSVPDSTPAYRGRMFRQVGLGSERRKATNSECKAAKAWDKERDSRGFPPWISSNYTYREDQPHLLHHNSVLESSWSFRQWADDYCLANKVFKEFEYRKVVYGWNFDAVLAATRSLITSTHYRGDIDISFQTLNSTVCIRSDNRLSRALSSGWIKFLLIITFIYPFLWLFRRFHPRGGGIWRVCGGAYALKRIDQVSSPPEYPGNLKQPHDTFPESALTYDGPSSGPDLQTEIIGLREGVWFRQWEDTIRRAIFNRLQASDPLVSVDTASPSITLDGY